MPSRIYSYPSIENLDEEIARESTENHVRDGFINTRRDSGLFVAGKGVESCHVAGHTGSNTIITDFVL